MKNDEIKSVDKKDKNRFDQIAPHPLQSWEWGEFRKKTGIEVIRLGRYQNEKLIEIAQLTIHQIPFTKNTIGYLPKSSLPSRNMLLSLSEIGKKYKCIFIKLEPNLSISDIGKSRDDIFTYSDLPIYPSPHPLFTKYTFQLDLTLDENGLLAKMHPKTRYNIKIAKKHGVIVSEDNSEEAFQDYLKLTEETAVRQKFYAHDRKYHILMWETLKNAKIAHLLVASLKESKEEHILTTWIVFLFNNILYYPYGASSNKYRNVMASNLMMWETIRFGKSHGAKLFDMWGALGPNPSSEDQWFGFHRFKQGYGPKHVEFIGSYDLIINKNLYKLYNLTYRLRDIFLRIKANIRNI